VSSTGRPDAKCSRRLNRKHLSMLTSAARRSLPDPGQRGADAVSSVAALLAAGWSYSSIRAQIDAHRWQRIGRAVIKHNGAPTAAECRRAALIVLGPRAVLTSFTAAEEWGLDGWEREPIHVLVPRGARVRRPAELLLRVHYTDQWSSAPIRQGRRLHRLGPAAVIAASSFAAARPACGIIAATVQQRLITPAELVCAVEAAPRTRHRAVLLAAAHDIGQGVQALSEIDLAQLCRRHRLPEPLRQAVRRDRHGRRRYLDAQWRRSDGCRVVVEVDGALHLIPRRWWDDQLRQNELVLAGDIVLRFPSVVVRCEPMLVLDQLRRALQV
jgi:very-short-patch-repair endonuclease